MDNNAAPDDIAEGFFQFQPPTLGSLFSSKGSGHTASPKLNGFSDKSYSFPSDNLKLNGTTSVEHASSSVVDGPEISGSVCSSSCGPENENENVVSGDKSQNGSLYHIEASRDHHIAVATTSSDPQQCVTISGTPEVTNPALKPKILLVEDNKINVMVTQSMMKQLGHSIDVVNNGVEAVRVVQRQSYDLILMDVCMPVMDGLQATKLIRSFEETGNWDAAREAGIEQSLPASGLNENEVSIPSTKRIPIIAMTANALLESAEECFANGMDSFVSKPVTSRKLKKCLEQYFQ